MALTDVSFEVAKGETLGIVGESGCGKSTLARCLVRLHEADAGAIRFDGEDVSAHEGAARRGFNRAMQMVFQDPNGSLNPRMRVGDRRRGARDPRASHSRADSRTPAARILDPVGLPLIRSTATLTNSPAVSVSASASRAR